MQQRLLLTALLLALTSPAWPLERDEINKLLNEKRYQEALSQINAQLSTRPKDADALFLQAVTLTRLERTKEAIASYKKLIDAHPNLPEPRNNLAVLYARLGEFQSAEQALQSALNTDPSYATAHGNLSDLYKTLASIAYNKALSLDNGKQPPASPGSRLRLIDELRSNKPAPVEGKSPATAAKTARAAAPLKTAPEPLPQRPGTTTENEKTAALNDIEGSVRGWANAWSQQDVAGYLNSYSAAFIPPGNIDRETWNEQRRDRIKSPGFIKIEIEQLEIQPLNSQAASVTFKQRYQSDRFAETTRKLLLLQLEEGQWRIVQEAETR
jgi:tetratricopeptide (TPR) repeat protein